MIESLPHIGKPWFLLPATVEVVVPACNHRTWEVEAGESGGVGDYAQLQGEFEVNLATRESRMWR